MQEKDGDDEAPKGEEESVAEEVGEGAGEEGGEGAAEEGAEGAAADGLVFKGKGKKGKKKK